MGFAWRPWSSVVRRGVLRGGHPAEPRFTAFERPPGHLGREALGTGGPRRPSGRGALGWQPAGPRPVAGAVSTPDRRGRDRHLPPAARRGCRCRRGRPSRRASAGRPRGPRCPAPTAPAPAMWRRPPPPCSKAPSGARCPLRLIPLLHRRECRRSPASSSDARTSAAGSRSSAAPSPGTMRARRHPGSVLKALGVPRRSDPSHRFAARRSTTCPISRYGGATESMGRVRIVKDLEQDVGGATDRRGGHRRHGPHTLVPHLRLPSATGLRIEVCALLTRLPPDRTTHDPLSGVRVPRRVRRGLWLDFQGVTGTCRISLRLQTSRASTRTPTCCSPHLPAPPHERSVPDPGPRSRLRCRAMLIEMNLGRGAGSSSPEPADPCSCGIEGERFLPIWIGSPRRLYAWAAPRASSRRGE